MSQADTGECVARSPVNGSGGELLSFAAGARSPARRSKVVASPRSDTCHFGENVTPDSVEKTGTYASLRSPARSHAA
ncbi:hypothetical protein F2P81_026252 [Scophthalmus maximus]|uniref:Uncharacterized protein n=1 Tax=Scophthalmus maximus TaxID=52904 RepID=A0A6A4RME3_SCOMX|nr:hypothetical protein F2P81_026252 [Scophthalmus maximus]